MIPLKIFNRFSFETLCTTSGTPLDLENGQVDPDTKWLSMISRKLGDLNIVIAGEVDCIKGNLYKAPSD
jgi:hypothetical protein